MDVTVTIVNWNGAALLAECLRFVFATPRTVSGDAPTSGAPRRA